VYQTTLLEQGDLTHQNLTVGDARCSSGTQKVQSIDVGQFYPTAAQASMTLWDFVFQRSASTYTIDGYDLTNRWTAYFEALWGGAAEYYSNPAYAGKDGKHGNYGWGLAPWDESLSNLLRNYSVGLNNQIDGAFAWSPYESRAGTGCQPLTDNDKAKWLDGSVLHQIILPALAKLVQAQTWYLQNTTIAAYLPVNGGVHADPRQQGGGPVMGAFAGNTDGASRMRDKFKAARARILNGPEKYEVRLDDVLDPTYRQQLEAVHGGTQGFGITAKPANAVLAWTPTGGTGPQRTMPLSRLERVLTDVAAEAGFIAAGTLVAGGLAWAFRDDLRNVVDRSSRVLKRGRR
jgi:hypothetical protein